MKILDANDPFFKPVWRRWVTAVLPLVWGGVEIVLGNPGWGILFVAAGGYALWALILKGPSDN